MEEIQYNKNLTAEENLQVTFNTINTLIREMNQGKVWDNQVQIVRTEENIYNSLPVDVQAAMIEEELSVAMAEMENLK